MVLLIYTRGMLRYPCDISRNMEALPTREILWNVHGLGTYLVMYSLLAVALVVATGGIFSRVELWRSGKADDDRSPSPLQAVSNLLSWGIFQRGVIREWAAGLMHTLIYFGFIVLLFTTTMVFIHHDLGIKIYQGNFYLIVTLFSDLFGLGLLIGIALAWHRRFIAGSDKLHNRPADSLLLIVLALLCIQGFLLEGLRILVTNDPWASWSPVGLLVSRFFWGISEKGARLIHEIVWWFHTVTVFSAIALAPYTKFFHIIASLANVACRTGKLPKGALRNPGDIEALMENAGDDFSIGLGSIKDYSWKQLLDLDACTSCGRCQDACPAYLSGKPLSPKWVILDTRNHMLTLHAEGKLAPSSLPESATRLDRSLLKRFFFPSAGVTGDKNLFRASNPLVQNESLIAYGGSPDARIAGEVMHPDVFWSCTTCMACVEACPVGIHHVDQIVGNRRNMALMQGEIPKEAQGTLRALENRANPYGAPEERSNWLHDLDVPILHPGDAVDFLYWVGCVSAFDPRKQKIAKALVTIMKEAGLSFGVLGNVEGCSGDPARRLGEENLFQSMAKANIATLQNVKFKTMVANCPHCFNTIKNEYPAFGNLGEGRTPEIIHHSQLLKRLIGEGRITLRGSSEEITFHDPCYLGRYNDEYDAPRDTLRAVKGLTILEMDRSREKGMCCGAGGGHFWMDLKIGSRVNSLRVDQAAETGAKKIATACPFCMQMVEDGVKLTGREASMSVKDIAEIVVENLETKAGKKNHTHKASHHHRDSSH